jgi:hypothetical protein
VIEWAIFCIGFVVGAAWGASVARGKARDHIDITSALAKRSR